MNILIQLKNNIEYEIYTLKEYLKIDETIKINERYCEKINENYQTLINEYNNEINLTQLQKIIETKKNYINKINILLYNTCNHEWLYDSIDIDPDTSKSIIYCNKCFINKEDYT
jgi:hypothetical protein